MSKHASNPYSPSYPVKPSLFAGRKSALARIRSDFAATCEGNLNNIFLEGEWGIGKTSLLNKIEPELQERGPVVRQDVVAGGDQLTDFLIPIFQTLLECVNQSAEDLGIESDLDRHNARRFLKILWDAVAGQGYDVVSLILDNLERAKPEFLSEVRDIFQDLGGRGARYMLIFAGRAITPGPKSAADPTARFFQRLPIEGFAEDESIEAIQKPIQIGYKITIAESAARVIHQRAAGHPYFLKAICSTVFELAEGSANVDLQWLEERWPEIEENLARGKFVDEFRELPEGEKETLLRASLLGEDFEAKELRTSESKSLDTNLRRLSIERGLLLRLPRHGSYRIYHSLFRNFLRGEAHKLPMKSTAHTRVEERRPAKGKDEVEGCIAQAANNELYILDQHFRGRAVRFLEAAKPNVSIRVLMGRDVQWSRTLESIGSLDLSLRKRITVRAWPESQENPVPWHVRLIIGDQAAFESSHSLDGVGKKMTYLSDKSAERGDMLNDFNRWWEKSEQIFPKQ